jgi:hypothetical protein
MLKKLCNNFKNCQICCRVIVNYCVDRLSKSNEHCFLSIGFSL